MQQIIKSNVTILGRNIWIEPFESETDIKYIKMMIEERILSLSNPKRTVNTVKRFINKHSKSYGDI